MIIELLILFFFSFLYRLMFVIGEVSSDDYVHLWNIKQRKLLKNLFSQKVTNSVVKGKRGYPILHHYLISLFAEKYWVIIGKILTIFYDILTIFLFYFIINFYFDFQIIYYFSYGFWGAILLSTSPILFPLTARVKAIGGRTAGFMLISIYLVIIYFFLSNDFNIFLIISSILMGIIILMTSQFAMQFFLMFNILLSIFLMNVFPFLIVCLVMGISYLIPFLRDIISFKIAHIVWFLNNQKGTTIENRNSIRELINVPKYLFKNQGKFIKRLFYESSYISALLNIPIFFYILFLYSFFNYNDSFLFVYLFYSLVITLIIFFLTSHKPMIIFGEAERYFEFVITIAIFSSLIFLNSGIISFKVIILFLFLNIITILFNFLLSNRNMIVKKLKNNQNHSYRELIEYLNTLNDISILTIPIKNSFKISVDLPQYNYYYRHINEYMNGFNYFAQEMQDLSKPIFDWHYFSSKYAINIIVIDTYYYIEISKYENGLKKLYENNDYIVYEIIDAKK